MVGAAADVAVRSQQQHRTTAAAARSRAGRCSLPQLSQTPKAHLHANCSAAPILRTTSSPPKPPPATSPSLQQQREMRCEGRPRLHRALAVCCQAAARCCTLPLAHAATAAGPVRGAIAPQGRQHGMHSGPTWRTACTAGLGRCRGPPPPSRRQTHPSLLPPAASRCSSAAPCFRARCMHHGLRLVRRGGEERS